MWRNEGDTRGSAQRKEMLDLPLISLPWKLLSISTYYLIMLIYYLSYYACLLSDLSIIYQYLLCRYAHGMPRCTLVCGNLCSRTVAHISLVAEIDSWLKACVSDFCLFGYYGGNWSCIDQATWNGIHSLSECYSSSVCNGIGMYVTCWRLTREHS